MEVLYKRYCGIYIHKNMLVAYVFMSIRKKEIRQFGTMTDDILQVTGWLKEVGCEIVAMESTGSYWKPVYNIFEEEQVPIIVVNAQHIKGVPGRKTDMKDAEWIADLVRHGLVKASFIPNREHRELREITRYRQELIEERSRELNRIQTVLEECNLKLGSVITDISGKNGIAILKAIVSGETNPVFLSQLAQGKARIKSSELQRALRGSIRQHQRLMLNHQLEHILKELQPYKELGYDYYDTCNHEKIIQRTQAGKSVGRWGYIALVSNAFVMKYPTRFKVCPNICEHSQQLGQCSFALLAATGHLSYNGSNKGGGFHAQ